MTHVETALTTLICVPATSFLLCVAFLAHGWENFWSAHMQWPGSNSCVFLCQLPPLLLSLEEVSPYRRVEEAFHCKLKGQVVVDKKTLVELQNFQSPLAKGAFLRGTGLNLATGRFTAPVSGIYQFSANIHIDHSELKSKVQLRARDNVRVLICIESLCHRYTSLEVIAGLESNSKIFTVYVHGLLQLQAGQYTSIFVDNSAGAPITIQNGSDFMGMLMGA
uniref:Adipolin n=1 Tax=Phasianus colchicus TaxID=9054 RepID=A0A669QVC9_PHACC